MRKPAIFMFVIVQLFLGGSTFFQGKAAAEIYNRVVAIVNADVVTLYELNTRMKEVTGLSPDALKRKSEAQYLEMRRRILEMLIEEKIALEKIKEMKINVPSSEVDAAIEKIKQENNFTQEDLVAVLRERGTSFEEYRKKLKTELEKRRLINYEVRSKIVITEEDVKAYYDEHKDEFSTQGKVRLAVIFLQQEDPADKAEARELKKKASQIMQKIKAGTDFGALAEQYSDGPGAKEGGDLGVFKITELNPEMAAAIKDLSSGEVGTPIVRPNGIQIIKVVEKDDGGEKSFEQVKNAIRSILYREKLDQAYAAWIKELREKSYTKIIF